MKKIFFFFISLLNITALYAGDNTFRFIENKNQWNEKVLFRADIPSGALFLEKNCFTYNFIDGRILSKIHARKDSTLPILDQLKLSGHAFKVHFLNSNEHIIVSGENNFSDYYNYFLGKDYTRWASHVKTFADVTYSDLYNGIDLRIATKGNRLKYEYFVLPGAKPSDIQMNYEGVEKISLREGQLILHTSVGDIIEKSPYAYQEINGRNVEVPCYFSLTGHTLSFAFPKGYNSNYSLIIDPVLIFATYSGSYTDNFGYTATYDSEGFLYGGSSSFGPGYPTTTGAYQTNFKGGNHDYYLDGTDIAITKYDTSGTKRIYSTFLGGTDDELPHSLIVDNNNNLLVLGTTSSTDFPVTAGAYDSTFAGDSLILLQGIAVLYLNGSDIFISKLSADGSLLLASTYLGGSSNDGLLALSDYTYDSTTGTYFIHGGTSQLRYNYADEVRGEIEIDNNNNIYIATCTKSTDFPIAGSSYQANYRGGNFEAVVVKLNTTLTNIIWSTYLGGNGDDAAYSIELDSLNNLYIGGGTNSSDFPTTGSVIYPAFQGGVSDGFISCLDSNGASLIYSTYYGSPAYDQVYFVDLDRFNSVFVFGQTMAPGSYFVFNAAYSNPNSGQFISKLKTDLNEWLWSTVFGNGSGQPNISPTAFLVDLCSEVYLSGWGGTPENDEFLSGNIKRPFANMPLKKGPLNNDYFQSTTDEKDFYLFVLKDDASGLIYASFYGGQYSDEHVDGGTSRFDRKGKIYQAICGGCWGNSDMPVYPAFGNDLLPDSNRSSTGCNCAVMKMDFNLPAVVADFEAQPGCEGSPIQFINKSLEQHATQYQWIFGDGNTSTLKDPTHTYSSGGTYNVTLIASDNITCNLGDTITKTLYISDLPASLSIGATSDQDTIYRGHSTYLHAIPNSGYLYSWSPAGSLNDANSANPKATPDTTTTYYLTVSDPKIPACKQNAAVKIVVTEINCNEPHIYVPNAFTPNGDGKNDILYVRSNYIENLYFTIYNRWGEKIFETRDQNIGWDGTFKGMKSDPGVFDYYLEVTCIDQQKFFKKGNVTLIR